jgi:hypothetical protein
VQLAMSSITVLSNTKISTKDIAVSAATWLRTVGNVELLDEITLGLT